MCDNKDCDQPGVDCAGIFQRLESTLILHFADYTYEDGESLRDVLDRFRKWELNGRVRAYRASYRGEAFSEDQAILPLTPSDYDDYYYWVSVYAIFFAGFRFQRVVRALPRLHHHFLDYRIVANYTQDQIAEIINDSHPDMICNERKIRACYQNAIEFRNIASQKGSFHQYRLGWPPIRTETCERYVLDIVSRTEVLKGHFRYFGPVVSLHYLMDIDEIATKPDVHACRVLYRLGFIASGAPQRLTADQKAEASYRGVSMALHAGLKPRYVDIVLMRFGLHICTQENPKCGICQVTEDCESFRGHRPY